MIKDEIIKNFSIERLDRKTLNELLDIIYIIYEGGGNTLDMIRLWNKPGFDKVLGKAWENEKYIVEQIDDSLEFKPLGEFLSRHKKIKYYKFNFI